MSTLLHLAAAGLTLAGVCCTVAERERARLAEVAASVVMMLAMLDAVMGMFPASLWAGALIVTALGVVAARWRTRRALGETTMRMTATTAFAALTMAVLLPAMAAPSSRASATALHEHGSSEGLVVVASIGCLALAAHCAVAAARSGTRLETAQYAAMGASSLLMAMAAGVG